MKSRHLLILVATLILAGGLLWLLRPVAAPMEPVLRIDPEDATLVARGRIVYAAQCAACHGAKLEGQPDWQRRRADGKLPAPPHDASGHTWHHSDQDLFDITKLGLAPFAGPDYLTDMPAFGESLSDADIRAVIGYIKSTWPDRERARQEKLNTAPPS